MAADVLTLTVPRTTYYLALVRRLVADVARRAGFNEIEIGEIEVAVDEVATRAVAHRFGEGLATHDILVVEARTEDGELEITLRDHAARARKTDSADEIDFNDVAKEYDLGGFDEFVVKTFMDEVEFTHRASVGNELRMVRRLPVGRMALGGVRVAAT